MSRNFANLTSSINLYSIGIEANTFEAVWMVQSGEFRWGKEWVVDGLVSVPAWGATDLHWAIGARYDVNPRLKEPKFDYVSKKHSEELIWEVYLTSTMQTYKSEADACAMWLGYLIQHGALSVKEVNARLEKLTF